MAILKVLSDFEKRKHMRYTEPQRNFQLYRRGRYVEYNLVATAAPCLAYKSNGRIESILVSLPPLTGWEYRYEPLAGTPEFEPWIFI